MRTRVFNRWQAAGTHLFICLAIAACVVFLMLALWYPGPLFEAAGGNGLLAILLGVDVTLGPLLTLIIFRPGKRGLKFDLAVIGLVQAGALLYGLSIVALARPAYIVFIKDRFDLATAADLPPSELAAAIYPQFRSVPWTGPVFVAADMPIEPAEFQKAMEASLAGRDLQYFPKYYVPYAERRQTILAQAASVDYVRRTDPPSGRAIDEYLSGKDLDPAKLRVLLLRTRFAWIVVLVDPETAMPVKMLLGERIE